MDDIGVLNQTNAQIKEADLKKIFFAAKKILRDRRSCDLSVVVAKKSFLKKLSIRYKKKDARANVLTFVYDSDKKHISGEIFICPQAIKKDQFLKYFIHSLLHFFGFHHNTQKAYLEMEKHQKKIISYLNQKNIII